MGLHPPRVSAFSIVVLSVWVATDAVWPYLKDAGLAVQATGSSVVDWRDNLRPLWWEGLLAAATCAVAVRKSDLAKDMAMPRPWRRPFGVVQAAWPAPHTERICMGDGNAVRQGNG